MKTLHAGFNFGPSTNVANDSIISIDIQPRYLTKVEQNKINMTHKIKGIVQMYISQTLILEY